MYALLVDDFFYQLISYIFYQLIQNVLIPTVSLTPFIHVNLHATLFLACELCVASLLPLFSPSLLNCIFSLQSDGDHERFHLEGIMESPGIGDNGECFSAISLNATSVNIEIYYNKAVNYTLMVTFVSFNLEMIYNVLIYCYHWDFRYSFLEFLDS